jgi:hypothetical protein
MFIHTEKHVLYIYIQKNMFCTFTYRKTIPLLPHFTLYSSDQLQIQEEPGLCL